MESHTERINRLLVLWLELQQAIRKMQGTATTPWECQDEPVAGLWREITRPENQRALEEWLFHVACGQSEVWAQKALLECRQRVARHH